MWWQWLEFLLAFLLTYLIFEEAVRLLGLEREKDNSQDPRA